MLLVQDHFLEQITSTSPNLKIKINIENLLLDIIKEVNLVINYINILQ